MPINTIMSARDINNCADLLGRTHLILAEHIVRCAGETPHPGSISRGVHVLQSLEPLQHALQVCNVLGVELNRKSKAAFALAGARACAGAAIPPGQSIPQNKESLGLRHSRGGCGAA